MLVKHATSVNLLSARPSLASIAPPRGLHGEQHIASALWLQLHSARTMHAVFPATSAILTPVLHGLWHSQATPAARAQPRCGTLADVVGWILWDGLYGEKKRGRQQWKLLYESYRPCHGVLVIIQRY
jgi:hypothetical protein